MELMIDVGVLDEGGCLGTGVDEIGVREIRRKAG